MPPLLCGLFSQIIYNLCKTVIPIVPVQVHYEWWRRILKYFWMSVVMYTMLVLTLVYTFQFDNSDTFWGNVTANKAR